MENIYRKAYKEVIEILKYLPKEKVDLIPKEMIEMFKSKQDESYIFEIDSSKSFGEQDLLEETKAILANIFRDYWATSDQRTRILAHENYERHQIEKEKREKYNPNEIFKKKR